MLDFECWMKNEFVGATHFHSKTIKIRNNLFFSAANRFYVIALYSFFNLEPDCRTIPHSIPFKVQHSKFNIIYTHTPSEKSRCPATWDGLSQIVPGTLSCQ